MIPRTVRFELIPQSLDCAVDEIQRHMAHIADCYEVGADDPPPHVVDVEIMADDAFLVVAACGGLQPIGIPVCVRSTMSTAAIVARLTACRPDFSKRTLH
jgi:hypothetical protein